VIIFGTQHYGKVDHLKGFFYVQTSFFHVQFVPLVPTGSQLILDRKGDKAGVSIPLSGRSVLWAYLRVGALVGAVVLGLMALVEYVETTRSGNAVAPGFLVTLAGAVGACVGAFLVFRVPRPSLERAQALGAYLGMPPELVEAVWREQAPGASAPGEVVELGEEAGACPRCHGMGVVTESGTDRDGMPVTREAKCPACQGKGVAGTAV
jgi:hypothetical protein